MSEQELLANGWIIEKHFHDEEAYYYYTAYKDRYLLTSDDGEMFRGLIKGVWL